MAQITCISAIDLVIVSITPEVLKLLVNLMGNPLQACLSKNNPLPQAAG